MRRMPRAAAAAHEVEGARPAGGQRFVCSVKHRARNKWCTSAMLAHSSGIAGVGPVPDNLSLQAHTSCLGPVEETAAAATATVSALALAYAAIDVFLNGMTCAASCHYS